MPDAVKEERKKSQNKGENQMKIWENRYQKHQQQHPAITEKYKACLTESIPKEAFEIPAFPSGTSMATRVASGKVLDYIAPLIPNLIGGSADLSPSNKTFPKGEESFSPSNPTGRYIHYGVREHGMGAIMNGLSLHGGILPYSGTFFVFADYFRPAIRMAALMNIQAIYVLTHDSIGLGEDGPTHQPVEHLASLRVMPNLSVIRPMCADETAEAWKIALQNKTKPTCLVLTRQNLPVYDREKLGYAPASAAQKGAYVLDEDAGFEYIIIATGSEVEIAVNAKEELNKQGFKIRIVSMPSTDVFDQQDETYKASVFPSKIRKRVAIEAAATQSWYKYVGLDGKIIGIDRFGASAPFEKLYQEFKITKEELILTIKNI